MKKKTIALLTAIVAVTFQATPIDFFGTDISGSRKECEKKLTSLGFRQTGNTSDTQGSVVTFEGQLCHATVPLNMSTSPNDRLTSISIYPTFSDERKATDFYIHLTRKLKEQLGAARISFEKSSSTPEEIKMVEEFIGHPSDAVMAWQTQKGMIVAECDFATHTVKAFWLAN